VSLAKTLLTAFVALPLAATASAQIRSATMEAGTYTAEVTVAGFVPFRETGLAIATEQTARVDVNLKVGTGRVSWAPATVEVTAQATQNHATQNQTTQNQAAKIHADSSAVTNATDTQLIDDVPNVTQNPLSDAMLQNGVQRRTETSTSTLGDL